MYVCVYILVYNDIWYDNGNGKVVMVIILNWKILASQ